MKRLNRDLLFESDHLSQNLAQKSIRGGMKIMAAQVLQTLLSTVKIVILARILTPNDYGLFGMVAVVVGFAQMFKDAGLSMATVQKDTISHEQISTLFWINILISTFLGVCVLVASPLVAKFYERPELQAVTAVLSISLLVSGLMIQHQALLRRHMQFGTLAFIQVASQVIALLVSIVLALQGWRHWALIWGNLTNVFSSTLLTLIFCPWIPSFAKRGSGVKVMLKFGLDLTGFNFANYFARSLDDILIGKYWGAQSLGIYHKAYSLVALPLQQVNAPISAVAIPALSRLQSDTERYRNYYLKAISLLCIFTLPLIMFMVVMSVEFIQVMLGDQWLMAAPIFAIFGFAAMIQVVLQPTSWLLLSKGQTGRYLKMGIFAALFLIISFILGLPYGPLGVARSYTIMYTLLTPFIFIYACKFNPVRTRDIIKVLWPPVLATFAAGAALTVFKIIHPKIFYGIYGLSIGFITIEVMFFLVLCLLAQSFGPVVNIYTTLNKHLNFSQKM